MGTYNRNLETGKLEMHFEKSEYMALSDDQKREIKSNFLFSRYNSAWVSRCKFPNLDRAERIAVSLGLENEGATGEKLSFEEQQERKAERAENRAERYDYKSDRAAAEGARLQAPIDRMHGDIAFFTQPNINTSSGRAFTRQRNRMWESYEKGFDAFRKSEYYAQRAETARQTAANAKAPDKAFCQRRIDEAAANIRKLTKSIDEYNGYMAKIEAGEEVTNKYGWKVDITPESITSNLERWEEIREDELSKLAYYDAMIQAAGGVNFSKDNIKVGYKVRISRYKNQVVEVIGTGTKNITYRFNDGFALTASYAEIMEVVSKDEPEINLPFKVDDEYTIDFWNGNSYEPKTYKVIKINGAKVTVKSGNDRAKTITARKGYRGKEWYLTLDKDSLHGFVCKAACD